MKKRSIQVIFVAVAGLFFASANGAAAGESHLLFADRFVIEECRQAAGDNTAGKPHWSRALISGEPIRRKAGGKYTAPKSPLPFGTRITSLTLP
jgi:hypothetical protein